MWRILLLAEVEPVLVHCFVFLAIPMIFHQARSGVYAGRFGEMTWGTRTGFCGKNVLGWDVGVCSALDPLIYFSCQRASSWGFSGAWAYAAFAVPDSACLSV